MIITDITDEKTLETPRFSSLFDTGVISIASRPAKLMSTKNPLPKYNTILINITKSNILLSLASPGCGNINKTDGLCNIE
jgi:hypothetical protein